MDSIIWLGLCLVLLFLEASTSTLICIWFAFGALIAFIVSLFGVDWLWCLLIFIAVSALTLIFTRKFAVRLLKKAPTPTNADLLIGKPAIVTEEIDTVKATGRVMINGQSWSAKARVGHTIKKGELVEVVSISGASLIVVSADNPLSTIGRSNSADNTNSEN